MLDVRAERDPADRREPTGHMAEQYGSAADPDVKGVGPVGPTLTGGKTSTGVFDGVIFFTA